MNMNIKTFPLLIIIIPDAENGVTYTSNAVSEYSNSSINKAYSLSYNGAGNISNILETSNGSSVSHSFVYDELNQLIRENNAKLNKTITYTYDAGGNILSVKKYPNTLDSLGEAIETKTYYLPFFKQCRHMYPRYENLFYAARAEIEPLIFHIESFYTEIQKQQKELDEFKARLENS